MNQRAFDFSKLLDQRRQSERLYLEFLRVPALSAGVYVLPAGGVDPQKPHAEDEVYYIVSGHGQIRVAAEDLAVGPGSIVFVEAGLEHRFHTIEEELKILVFFAPAET
jgi:mannose-6-phosphate isomerase-like protein (cupin superfamily)